MNILLDFFFEFLQSVCLDGDARRLCLEGLGLLGEGVDALALRLGGNIGDGDLEQTRQHEDSGPLPPDR